MSERLDELVQVYIDGALSPTELAEFQAALAEPVLLARTATQVREHQLLRAACRTDAAVRARQVGAVIDQRHRWKISTRRLRSIRTRTRPRTSWRWWMSVAAMIMVGAILALSEVVPKADDGRLATLNTATAKVWIYRGGDQIATQVGMGLFPQDEIETADEVAELSYPDGSRIRLLAETRIRLWEDGGAKRLHLGNGEIHNEIAVQPEGRPLVIDTFHSLITVVGTVFDVTTAEAGTHLAVASGRVRFSDRLIGGTIEVSAGSSADIKLQPELEDACLPIRMPSPDMVLNAPKKVFAHYFPPLPLSMDNRPATEDYYTTQYLSPHGENDKFLSIGGMLRARPLPVRPLVAGDWQERNLRLEIGRAISRGINGFAFDIMSVEDAAADGKLRRMLTAAQTVDPRFAILLQPDMGSLPDAQAVERIVLAVHGHPSLYHLPDGRLVLTPHAADRIEPAIWSAMLHRLRGQGIRIAFLPVFGSLDQDLIDHYAGISDGLGEAGNPGLVDLPARVKTVAARVRASSALLFSASVMPQVFRPLGNVFSEACGSLAYREAWKSAIETQADMVRIVTWNDYGDASNVAPATSLAGDSGTGFYNLTSYYATWFQTGNPPEITKDVVYYFYRKHASSLAKPTVTWAGRAPVDQIELLAFLRAPGTVTISIGGETRSMEAPAGITSFCIPSLAGVPQFRLLRQGVTLIDVSGKTRIQPTGGLPSDTLDLTYWSGSASALRLR